MRESRGEQLSPYLVRRRPDEKRLEIHTSVETKPSDPEEVLLDRRSEVVVCPLLLPLLRFGWAWVGRGEVVVGCGGGKITKSSGFFCQLLASQQTQGSRNLEQTDGDPVDQAVNN